jgi:hypothetical protein
MLTLLGGLFGGLFRLAPELMKWLDKKDERAHELSMFDKQIEADKLRSEQKIDEIETQGQYTLDTAGLAALQEAIKAQGQMTGIKWVDGVNSMMRPLITFWWVIVLSTVAEVCMYISLLHAGVPGVDAVLKLWGPEEKATVAGIINFWFLDRVIRRR